VEISTSLDEGGRQLASHILNAAALGDDAAIAQMIDPLDADQLRSLVTLLAAQVDQTMPDTSASGPAAVCEQAIAAAAQTFGTTHEAIVGNERSRTVSDARAVAMTVARETGLSLPAIGQHFNKDHGSVIHALRRTTERPRLEDAASRISEHLQRRFSAALPRPANDTAAQAPPAADSAFQPSGIVEHAVVATAKEFGTTPEVLLSADRTRAAADARAVAMTAARMHGQSLPRIAGHFDRDHTTVLHATRRIEKTPPLRALAAKIAANLPNDVDEHQDAAAVESTWEKVTSLPSLGAREARPAREQQPDRGPLQAAP
jgi:hypothetical protein